MWTETVSSQHMPGEAGETTSAGVVGLQAEI
jgi:hypothetical protein